MIHNYAYLMFLGYPLVMYLGILTFLLILFTATVGALNFKGNNVIPFKWHPILAKLTITMALIHGILGLSIYFNF